MATAPLHRCPAAPRHIYIDLGTNWGNTARLFEDIGRADTAYEVFGFEAAPLVLQSMIKDGTMPLIDVLALECHGWVPQLKHTSTTRGCDLLKRAVRTAAPQLTLLIEGEGGYDGVDRHSHHPPKEQLERLTRECNGTKQRNWDHRPGTYRTTSFVS